MSDRVILKLGGSVITDKGADCIVNREQIAAIATAIAGVQNNGTVVIHGAGSCGHPEAHRYHLDTGATRGRLRVSMRPTGWSAASMMRSSSRSGRKVWLQSVFIPCIPVWQIAGVW